MQHHCLMIFMALDKKKQKQTKRINHLNRNVRLRDLFLEYEKEFEEGFTEFLTNIKKYGR